MKIDLHIHTFTNRQIFVGALIAQLTAQKSPNLMSKLILYGSIYDPLVRYPRTPLYLNLANGVGEEVGGDDTIERSIPPRKNTFNDAIEDFTVEGSIPPEPARLFAQTALMTDPFKAKWTQLCQFNNLDPARIHIPTLVVRIGSVCYVISNPFTNYK